MHDLTSKITGLVAALWQAEAMALVGADASTTEIAPPESLSQTLSEDQERALDLLFAQIAETAKRRGRKTLTLVGSAGTGKTTLIRVIAARLNAEIARRTAQDGVDEARAELAVLLDAEENETRTAWDDLILSAELDVRRAEWETRALVLTTKERTRYEKFANMGTSLAAAPAERALCVRKIEEMLPALPTSSYLPRRILTARNALQRLTLERDNGQPPPGMTFVNIKRIRELQRQIAQVTTPLRWAVQYAAPTGKAALRLTEITGVRASTVHRILYGSIREVTRQGERRESLEFGNPHAPCDPCTLLIVDEASMISAELHRDLELHMPSNTVLLYVGDREQLPPVEGTWGPDLANPTAGLIHVHRQALGNPVLRLANEVRNGVPFHKAWRKEDASHVMFRQAAYGTKLDFRPEVVQWIVDRRDRGTDATVIVYTNAVRQDLNGRVRRALGLDGAPVSVGDLLLVRMNNHNIGAMNGEVLTVESVRTLPPRAATSVGFGIRVAGRSEELFVNGDMIGLTQSEYRKWAQRYLRYEETNWLHVDYGQVLTCHVSQGSQWSEIGILWESACWAMHYREPETARRWMYTAITRAKHRASVWYTG
jgi:exodeoxyribonuclease-5